MKFHAVGVFMAFLLVSGAAASLQAAEYPEQNITIVVPFPPGGASDTTARMAGNKLSERIGKPVVIENRAGANGAIGAATVKQAKPDGYTLLVGSIGVYAINPALYKNLKYDPQKDFDLLSVVVRTPNVLVTSPQFPVKNVAELIAYLKKNPNKVTFASSGVGSSDHLTAALFWQKTGTTGIHVPYKGGAPAINDLMGGHADVSFQNLGAVAQQIRGGQLKALAVTGDKRADALPDVPTIAEAGVADLVVYSWQAAAAPRGLPAEIKAKLESEFKAAATAPDVKKKFTDMGFDVVATNGAQFVDFLKAEVGRWKTVVETGKIAVE
ncbi:MAG: tripartite tricarboxylate transporter substrate binding protein [Betaproteobacteria bacterium]|nr:tripartite tricarboxylate transporter substrate binding protein [Betaproteobacteria bacterium]